MVADITKCSGVGCTKKQTCHRYTATANEYRQSYFCSVPLITLGTGEVVCDHYWLDVEEKRKK